MKVIGERVTLFWYGESYRFEYVGRGEWKCHSHSEGIPSSIREVLKAL
jgi:hypothetical protein